MRRVNTCPAAAARLAMVSLLLLSACVSSRPGSAPQGSARDRAAWERYFKAIEAARYPDRSKISKQLRPILHDKGLIWRDGRILMVTWTKARYYTDLSYVEGYEFPLYGDTWLTLSPEAQDLCRAYRGKDLDMRVRQILGLPPNEDNDAFLLIWVRPEDLFRPCPDPEITDSTCRVRVELVDHPRPNPLPRREKEPTRPPWYCPEDGQQPRQVGGKFLTVHQAHLNWMCKNWIKSYTNDEPKDNYPWTALGYVYDWGRPKNPRGLSEYVAIKGAPVVFERLAATDAYCFHH